MLFPMSYNDLYNDSIESKEDGIWVVDPQDWPDSHYAGSPDAWGKKSKDLWLENIVLAVLPWAIVLGFTVLGVLALLGLIAIH